MLLFVPSPTSDEACSEPEGCTVLRHPRVSLRVSAVHELGLESVGSKRGARSPPNEARVEGLPEGDFLGWLRDEDQDHQHQPRDGVRHLSGGWECGAEVSFLTARGGRSGPSTEVPNDLLEEDLDQAVGADHVQYIADDAAEVGGGHEEAEAQDATFDNEALQARRLTHEEDVDLPSGHGQHISGRSSTLERRSSASHPLLYEEPHVGEEDDEDHVEEDQDR